METETYFLPILFTEKERKEYASLVLTVLIVKPLDLILDRIYRKPAESRMLRLSPEPDGVRYVLTRKEEVLAKGLMTWTEWKSVTTFDTNEIYILGERLQIGRNSIESIYPKEKQKKWMDCPDEKISGVIQLKTISRNFEGYLASLEEKRKEAEWEARLNGAAGR